MPKALRLRLEGANPDRAAARLRASLDASVLLDQEVPPWDFRASATLPAGERRGLRKLHIERAPAYRPSDRGLPDRRELGPGARWSLARAEAVLTPPSTPRQR